MNGGRLKILLVEDNPGDARLIREMLVDSTKSGFEIEWVPRLSAGLEMLGQGEIDLVLLDLGLPDSRGLNTFIQAYAHAPEIPFVVLTGLDDENLALSAVREGAQDYLVKGQTDGSVLLRAIRYATERKKIEEDLRQANEELRREIAERRAAETALDAERQRLFALLDGLPAMVNLKGPDYSIHFANRIFRETFGDWENKRCFEVVGKRTGLCQNCPTAEVFRTGVANCREWTDPVNEVTYQLHNYPFADVDGSTQVLSLGIDVTGRKQAEEALKESERKYRLLMSAIPAVVFKGYADWNIEFFDGKIEELTGYPPEDFNSRRLKWSDLILKEDLALAKKAFVQALKDDGAYVREYRIRTRTGQTLWIQARGRIVYQPNGKIDHISGVFYDISELKEATEALLQSEARLAKAQSLAHLGHWEWDLASNKVIWSEEVSRILGVAPEKIIPSFDAGMNFMHPDDLTRVRQLFDDLLVNRQPLSTVIRIVRPDGSLRYLHVRAEVLLGEDSQPRRLVGTAQDITERRTAEILLRESEARFRAIFEGAAMGIGLTDMRGQFLTINKTMQTMLGYAENEIRGKRCLDFTHPGDVEVSREFFHQLESGSNRLQLVKRLQRRDGRYFWGRTTVSLVKDADGQPLYTIGMVEDITQAKHAEEWLQESEARLRYLASRLMTAQEDERRRISRELHDELGQSLLVLKLQARCIERGLQPDQQPVRQECRELLENLDRVVDNVRRLSRDLSPTILEDLGLSAALRRLLRDFSKHYRVELRADQVEGIDHLFNQETGLAIFRIFQESLTNIGKHSRAADLTVTINKNDDRVSFLIEDNGIGFNPSQGRGPTSGMGLAAMEERARMVGGVLTIWSQEGSGTRISLDIPYSLK